MGTLKRYSLIILFAGVSAILVGGLTYFAGTLGIERDKPLLLATQILVTVPPPLPGTPVARFGQLDPAIIAYLDRGQPSYSVISLDARAKGVQPVGAYLPRVGNTQFEIAITPSSLPVTAIPTLDATVTLTPMPNLVIPTIPPDMLANIFNPVPVRPSPTDVPPPTEVILPPTAAPPPVVAFVPTAAPLPTAILPPTAAPVPQNDPPIAELLPTSVLPPTADVPPPTIASVPTDVPPPPTSQPPSSDCAPAGLPAQGVLMLGFSQRHIGIDIGVYVGTPLYATQSGTVIFSGWNDIGYGNLVAIRSGAFGTYYGHQSSVAVSVGQYVTKGSLIGWSGNSGNSSGPHVHYETRINDVPVDPLTFESRGYGTC